MTDLDKESWLTTLKGWALGLADSIDKYRDQIISGESIPVTSQNAESDPRAKIARLVREIGEIHEKVQAEVYGSDAGVKIVPKKEDVPADSERDRLLESAARDALLRVG